jgi:malate synthase
VTEDQRTILRKAIVQFELGETMVFYREIGEQIAAALRALLDENADLKERIDKAYEDIALDQRTNETLRAEVAALKANDPLAEMWRELEAYLPRANANGHGRSWKRMCSERTEEAAREESFNVAAAAAARDAAAWAADAMSAKQARANSAKDAIRRAKEAKP